MFPSVRVAPLILTQSAFVVRCLVFEFGLRVEVRVFVACFVVHNLCVRLLVRFFCGGGKGGKWGYG